MNNAVSDMIPWIWLALKAAAFLLLSLSSVEIIVIAYQQF